MRETNPDCPNFLDIRDSRFRQLQHTLDALFHKLHPEGIGVQVKHAEVLTKDDKAKLWNSGVMSAMSPKSLQKAAFYVVGKMFTLCGGVEHRSLKLSQIKQNTNPDHYVYYENVSKNMNGSFKQIHLKKKNRSNIRIPKRWRGALFTSWISTSANFHHQLSLRTCSMSVCCKKRYSVVWGSTHHQKFHFKTSMDAQLTSVLQTAALLFLLPLVVR